MTRRTFIRIAEAISSPLEVVFSVTVGICVLAATGAIFLEAASPLLA